MLTPLPPPPPRDLGPRAQRLGAQAAAVVLLGLFGFALAGMFVDTDEVPAAAPSVEESPRPSSPTPTEQTSGVDASPSAAGSEATSSVDPTPTGVGTSPSATATSETDASPSASEEDRIEPSTIRIQVLDGVLDDGREAANEVAAELRAAGYYVVVVNQANKRYERTTVFYVDGQEQAGRQVGNEFGFLDVDPKPDNLSNSVELHVVVGRDRA